MCYGLGLLELKFVNSSGPEGAVGVSPGPVLNFAVWRLAVVLCITGGPAVLSYGRCRPEGTLGLVRVVVALGSNRRLSVVVVVVVA